MKRNLITIVAILTACTASAQLRLYYTQYVLNQYLVNPAISGIENYTDVKLSARDQWTGLNGAPRAAYLTVHAPIGKKRLQNVRYIIFYSGTKSKGKILLGKLYSSRTTSRYRTNSA